MDARRFIFSMRSPFLLKSGDIPARRLLGEAMMFDFEDGHHGEQPRGLSHRIVSYRPGNGIALVFTRVRSWGSYSGFSSSLNLQAPEDPS